MDWQTVKRKERTSGKGVKNARERKELELERESANDTEEEEEKNSKMVSRGKER